MKALRLVSIFSIGVLMTAGFMNCQQIPAGSPVTQSSVVIPTTTPDDPTPTPTPTPTPVVIAPTVSRDFLDVVGAPVSTLQSGTAAISAAQQVTIAVSGFDSQISLDGTTWSTSLQATGSIGLRIRMTSESIPNTDRRAIVSVGGTLMDWIVSTTPALRTFATPGTFTYARPTVGRTVQVECWGGGGGGARGAGGGTVGGGGGGGGYSLRMLNRGDLLATENVVVGAGGIENENGGNTTFGAHLVAGGGKAGLTPAVGSTSGLGGTGVTAAGSVGVAGTGGAGGGPGGGAGGGLGQPGIAPGGGAGGTAGSGGGGVNGNGGAAPAAAGAGRCRVTVVP